MSTTANTKVTLGSTLKQGLTLVSVGLSRSINIADLALESVEHTAKTVNNASSVMEKSSDIWKTQTIAEQQAELDNILAEIAANKATS